MESDQQTHVDCIVTFHGLNHLYLSLKFGCLYIYAELTVYLADLATSIPIISTLFFALARSSAL